jgi:hypothetical protein
VVILVGQGRVGLSDGLKILEGKYDINFVNNDSFYYHKHPTTQHLLNTQNIPSLGSEANQCSIFHIDHIFRLQIDHILVLVLLQESDPFGEQKVVI